MLKATEIEALKRYLKLDNFLEQVEKNINNFINSEPESAQEASVIETFKEYKKKSTSGQMEARNAVRGQIRTDLLTRFNIYEYDEQGKLSENTVFENLKLDEKNKLIDYIIPFDNPEQLTAREKFSIMLIKNSVIEKNGRDGAFRRFIEKHNIYFKERETEDYSSLRYEYSEEDIERIYEAEQPKLSFADKVEILAQRIYEELYGLKHIDILAYSDVNEVGFAYNGEYVYCWCGRKIRLGFLRISEADARVIQDRVISFDTHTPQLDKSQPEVLCHRGDNARITVTQQPYFSARNLCIRIFNQSNSSFRELIKSDIMRTIITAFVRAEASICLQGPLGTGKTTTMNIMYELLDDFLHIGTVEDHFEQHVMEKYKLKRIVEGQAVPDLGKSILNVVQTLMRMSIDVANLGEVRDGEALYAFIQLVMSVSIAAWFTTHITDPETTVPKLKNQLTGTGKYFTEQSAVMDIVQNINLIFQHGTVDGNIAITQIVEIVPLVATSSQMDYGIETDKDVLEKMYYIQKIQENPYNMYSLNYIMDARDGNIKFLNYPSPRMINKAKKTKESWEYMMRLVKLIQSETDLPLPKYLRG